MSRCWVALPALLLLASIAAPALAQESPACEQARRIVAEVEGQMASEKPDTTRLLARLTTARDLCSTLGEAWRLSACLAESTGDSRKAQMYRDRAVLSGVVDVSCPRPGEAAAKPTPRPLGPVQDKHALLIGIGQFADPMISRLAFAAKDAKDVRDALVSPTLGRFPPENVELLTDQAATRAGILAALQRLILRAGEDDLVVLYLSSHGSPNEASQGLLGVGSIVTHDTKLDQLYLDSLAFEDFSRRVSLVKARRKVLLLDTCYSAQALPAGAAGGKNLRAVAGVSEETAKLFLSSEGTYFISSSADAEQSWESKDIENSYFTYYLLEALRQGKEPPTLSQVFRYLATKVTDAVIRDKNAKQTPQFHPATALASADLRLGAASLRALSAAETKP